MTRATTRTLATRGTGTAEVLPAQGAPAAMGSSGLARTRRTRRRAALLLGFGVAAGLLATAVRPPTAAADIHKDDEYGYSILVPQGWREIPIAVDEKYIVLKYQCDREYSDKIEGYTQRPDLKVIVFDPKGTKKADVTEAEGVRRITIENPYKNFKEWVKSDAQGGRYISEEKETTVNGLTTTWYEVKYEKLTVPRHGIAFVYHTEDVDFCATIEVLEQHWEKLKPLLLTTMKSFKVIPRKAAGKVGQAATTGEGGAAPTPPVDTAKLTPEERAKARQQRFERDLKTATDRLPDGWTVKRSKNYVALTHVDDKYTSKILELAESVRAWAETNLGYFGDGVAGSDMFRICKDQAEERSFTDLSSRSGGWSSEIVISKDDGLSEIQWIAYKVFSRWVADKNPRMRYGMPPWLDRGLDAFMGAAYPRGGKLEFRPDGDLIVALKLAAKFKQLIPVREMVQLTSTELMKKFEDMQGTGKGNAEAQEMLKHKMSPWQQTAGFIRFLMQGPGRTNPRTKDLLKNYVLALDEVLRGDDEKPLEAGAMPAAAKTEEEEEEQFKNRQNYWQDRQKDLLKAVYDKVFGQWTEADWAALERSYAAFAS